MIRMTMMPVIYFVLLCSPSFSSENVASLDCYSAIRTFLESTKKPIPNEWDTSKFSNPSFHKAGEPYLYAVHAISEATNLEKIAKYGLGRSKSFIFSSLVNKELPTTFAAGLETGFILDFKPQHVIGNSSVDTRFTYPEESLNQLREVFSDYAKKYPPKSPEEILKGMGKIEGFDRWNNEIALKGVDGDGKAVKVSAVFIWTDKNGDYSNLNQLRTQPRVIEFATNNNLPIVQFRSPYEAFHDMPMNIERDLSTDTITRLSFQRNLTRYEIDLTALNDSVVSVKMLHQDKLKINKSLGYYHPDIINEFKILMENHPNIRNELQDMKNNALLDDNIGSLMKSFYEQVII